MNSIISNKKTDGDSMSFTISSINVSFVNAIRRTILSDIPIAVFKTFPYDESDCIIHTNTTRFNNEILKQRLSCIPIFIDIDDIPVKNLVVKVQHLNTKNETQYLTTKQFKIYNKSTEKFLPDSLRDTIFPPNNISKQHIDFVRLLPGYIEHSDTKSITGEEIDLECKISVGMAKQNAMYNAVSMATFTNTVVSKEELDVHFNEYIKNFTKNENLNDAEKEIAEQDWYALNAKRHFIPDSFDCKFTTACVYNCQTLITKACNILIDKFKVLIDPSIHNAYNITMEIKKNNTFAENCFDVVLHNESYTIGKIIEYVLFDECIQIQTPTMSFVSFLKEHPHYNYSLIRIVFINDVTEGHVVDILNEKFQRIIEVFEHITPQL